MDGILVSFWETLFSGAMLVSGRVLAGGFKRFCQFSPWTLGKWFPISTVAYFSFMGGENHQLMIKKIWQDLNWSQDQSWKTIDFLLLFQPLWVSMPMPKDTFSSLTFSTVKLPPTDKAPARIGCTLKRWYLLPVTRSAPGYECCKIGDEIYIYIYRDYVYLEPVCPLFWWLNPSKQGLFQSKQGSFWVPGI